jgi:3-oxoacyl-[acyl-carrier-protein] synthase II
MTAPDPEGKGAARAMERALKDAGVSPEEVGYINAHGTATPANDAAETKAIKTLFGERAGKIPVSSSKSMIGHCLGAAGALEAVAAVLAVRDGRIPPTIHYETPDPECDLDYVPNQAREAAVNVALSNSFAFGGNNTALVFGKWK